MTLKRKCAQRSWDREVDEVAFMRGDVFVFFTTAVVWRRLRTVGAVGVIGAESDEGWQAPCAVILSPHGDNLYAVWAAWFG
jgi:hypothetical protein